MDDDDDSRAGDTDLLRELAAAPAVTVPVDFATLVLLQPGTVIDNAFQIEERLGSGGMGVIYAARDLKLGREVAIKLMRLERGAGSLGAKLPEVFEREARATARLNHPNIVTLYQFGNWNGILYLVLERLRGETLATQLARGAVSLRRGLAIMEAVAHALVHTHAAGIVHRDLKPQNVFLLANGGVKVLDFGVSGLAFTPAETIPSGSMARDRSRSTLLHAGTPGYMAPEQWRGEPHDARSDVWAVGVMLYQLGAGKLPFDTAPITVARTPPPLPEAAAAIAPVVARCLSEPCALRPDAADLASALGELQGKGDHVAATGVVTTPATARVYSRRRGRTVLIGLAAASLVVGVVGAVTSRDATERACDGVSGELADVWDEPVKARLAAAFTQAGPDGVEAWGKVALAGDRYAGEWLTLRKAACVSGTADHLATSCLADARSALRGFVAGYSDVPLDAPQLAAAIGEVGALPPLSRCVAAASTTGSNRSSGSRLLLTVNGAGKEVVHGAVVAGDDVIVAGYMSPGAAIAGVRLEQRRTAESLGIVARITSGREVRWRQVVTHGSMTSIADGTAGRVLVAGRYTSPATFAGRELPAANENCFVASLDATTGAVMWLHTCGGSMSLARGVAADQDGNVYAIGDFAGRARFGGDVEIDANARPVTSPYVASWTRDGTLRWVTTGRGTALGESFAIAVAGDAVVIGARILGAGQLGNHALVTGGCVLARLDSQTGAVRWLRETAGSHGDCKVRSVAIRGDRVAAGGAEIERTAGWVTELALADGSVLWEKSFAAHVAAATPPVRSVAYAATGELIVGGYFNTDRLVTDCAPLMRRGDFDAFVLRFDRAGHCTGTYQIGASGEEVMIRWIGFDARGRVLAAGRYQKALTLDAAPVDSAGSSDGFLVELPASW
jgi:outer membrane protein assembly factor BamB